MQRAIEILREALFFIVLVATFPITSLVGVETFFVALSPKEEARVACLILSSPSIIWVAINAIYCCITRRGWFYLINLTLHGIDPCWPLDDDEENCS